jgi:hypothetical protein
MRSFRTMLVAAAAVAAATAPTGAAPMPCAERADIVQKLDDAYSEKRQASALTSTGSVLEVYVSMSGTWSMLVSKPDGTSCVVAVGEAWEPRQMIASSDPGMSDRKFTSSSVD